MKNTKKLFAGVMSCILSVSLLLAACENGNKNTTDVNPGLDSNGNVKEGYIANRDIKGRIFLENDGAQLPQDQLNNDVAKKIKDTTGISMEWLSSGAQDGLSELTAALASGDLPEVMVNYLDHGGRPEMSVMLKAAREGLLTDLRPYLEKTKVLKKYLDPSFLPRDTQENIMFRPEFDGKVYFIHMNIPRENITDADRTHGRQGMWIREDIAKALKIEPSSIKTQDDLYNLAVKIKEGNFTDKNGKPVTIIGPRIWGGQVVSTLFKNYDFGNGTRFDVDKDGKVKHVAETEYVMKQVEFVQKLLKEGLLHKEAFNMDNVRSEEAMNNGSFAITAFAQLDGNLYRKVKYLPLDQMNNYKGEDAIYEKEKAGNQAWSIPATTENPEDIVKFADYLASKEGKTLWKYGIEGKHYTVNNEKYTFTPEFLKTMNEHPEQAMDVVPFFWGSLLGSTDGNDNQDFGEIIRGANSEPEKYTLDFELMNYGSPKYKYWDGYSALSYLSEVPSIEASLKPVLDSYADILVKAFFTKSLSEAEQVIADYRDQLKQSGVEEFEKFLQDKYDTDAKSVVFYMNAFF